MKRRIRMLSMIAALFALSAPMVALANGDQDVKKTKLINKSYDVGPEDKLEIDNQFGNVAVSTWDKPQITVDIEISARAASEERAKDIMDKIDVHDSRDGHAIRFKTEVEEIHNSNGNRHNNNENDRSFYIDYVIHMPTGNRLAIENSFGKTQVPAFKGLVSLTSKFGSLEAGALDNVDDIDVEFGKAYITSIHGGKVVFKFNKESHIGMVDGNVKISSEFSQNVQFRLGEHIQELSIFESYSGVRVIVDHNLSANFEVHTSFGHFNNESDFEINEHKDDNADYGPHFDKDYSGTAGDGKARIRIKSSFGTVRLTHNGSEGGREDEDDDRRGKFKDKHKGKDKDKDSDSEG